MSVKLIELGCDNMTEPVSEMVNLCNLRIVNHDEIMHIIISKLNDHESAI